LPPAGGFTLAPVAVEEQVAPGTGGAKFSAFGAISLDDSGEVLFDATLVSDTNSQGIFAVRNGGIRTIAVDGDPAPGTGGGR